MKFIINKMKYDTEKMEKVAKVKKWYKVENIFTRALYGDKEVGMYYECDLWKSKKGNWLVTHENDYKTFAEAINEKEAKDLMMKYATDDYEKMFGDIPEA